MAPRGPDPARRHPERTPVSAEAASLCLRHPASPTAAGAWSGCANLHLRTPAPSPGGSPCLCPPTPRPPAFSLARRVPVCKAAPPMIWSFGSFTLVGFKDQCTPPFPPLTSKTASEGPAMSFPGTVGRCTEPICFCQDLAFSFSFLFYFPSFFFFFSFSLSFFLAITQNKLFSCVECPRKMCPSPKPPGL